MKDLKTWGADIVSLYLDDFSPLLFNHIDVSLTLGKN